MPVDMSRYPSNWKQISHHVRFERAQGQCEWCGVKHGDIGARDSQGRWYSQDEIDHMNGSEGDSLFGGEYPKIVKIILTTAHIGLPRFPGDKGDKHNKMDCRLNNLKALCQRCHLRFDLDEHIENRKRTLYRRKHKQYQDDGNQLLPLFDEIVGVPK